MITSAKDFELGASVPNAKSAAPLSGEQGGNSALDAYIAKYEKQTKPSKEKTVSGCFHRSLSSSSNNQLIR